MFQCICCAVTLIWISFLREKDIYLKGEMAKALPVSPKRIKSLTVTDDDLWVELAGTPSESVDFEICQLSKDHSTCTIYPCVISDGGRARLSLSLGPTQCR